MTGITRILLFKTDFPRVLRFPVPLDKGNGGSGNEIVLEHVSRSGDKVSSMAPKYVLTYFDVRGRGEPTRLLFKAAGVEFEDRRLSFEEWGKEKEQLKSGECNVTDLLTCPAKI